MMGSCILCPDWLSHVYSKQDAGQHGRITCAGCGSDPIPNFRCGPDLMPDNTGQDLSKGGLSGNM